MTKLGYVCLFCFTYMPHMAAGMASLIGDMFPAMAGATAGLLGGAVTLPMLLVVVTAAREVE